MSADFWLGVATPFAIALLAWAVISIVSWLRWWWLDPRTRLGGGFVHVADVQDEDGTWYPRGQHTHDWPPRTPWWLRERMEPVRIWFCYRKGDHRPPTPRGGTDE